MSEHPRITYQCSKRVFDRLFKEQSLNQTKDVVRKKLGLAHDTAVELAQVRDGRRIDLEDDDDFEAFKALTKSSLHSIVAVTIPENSHLSSAPVGKNAPVEASNGSPSEPSAQEAGQSESSSMHLPSARVTDSSRPKKKRKVTFNGDNGDFVASAAPQPSQHLTSEDVRPSSPYERPPTSIHKSTSEPVAPPLSAAMLRQASQVENLKSSSAETSRRKRKRRDSAPSGKESSLGRGDSNNVDVVMPSSTQKKRVRKEQTTVSVIPTKATREEVESLDSSTKARGKTGKQKIGPVDAESSATGSKMGQVDPTEDRVPDLTKSLKRRASKKEVALEVSKPGLGDDIDKTIAAFMTKKRHADPSTFLDVAAACEPAVLSDDPPTKTKRKGSKVKLGAGKNSKIQVTAQGSPPDRAEGIETNSAKTSTTGEVNRRTTERILAATTELPFAAAGPHGSQPLGSTTQTSCPACLGASVHPLAECPVVIGGLASIEVRIAQMEKNPGLAPFSEVIPALRRLAENARSMPLDPSDDSLDVESSRVSAPSVALYGGSTGTREYPTTPRGHEISEVPVEAHGEGSSNESSTEGENEDELDRLRTPVNSSSVHLHLEDQPIPLIHGSAKRGPRRSILDEIPSSSETGSKSSSEDLVLDEEEDLSLQPSHKQTRKLSTTRSSSIEPEPTSEDEDDPSMPVYMDTSPEALDRSHKIPAIGGDWDNVSISSEVGEVSARPLDTYPIQPPEAGKQDHSISSQTRPNKIDATAPRSQSSTKIFRPASPESDVAAINAEATKSPNLASTEQQTGRVLVPASSPVVDKTVGNRETKGQSEDANDDVESAAEPPGGDEESDPIEAELTQPPANRPSRRTDATLRGSRRRARRVLSPPPVSDLPSRRSGRLANRQSSERNSEATLVPLTQVRRKMTSALERSGKEKGVIRDNAREGGVEKSVRKLVGETGVKPASSTAQRLGDSGDDTSPSVAREDGSPTTSHVKRTQSSPSVIINEVRTSNQGLLGKLSQGTSSAEKKTPVLSGRGAATPSRRKTSGIRPLFFPGSSQVAPRALSPPPSGSENESETVASLLPRKTPTKSTPGRSQFRRLTDLTSSDILFSKSKSAQRRFKNTPSLKAQPRFEASDGGEDDDESSSSSEDRVTSSHIPRERRAGATTRKGRGLSSLGD